LIFAENAIYCAVIDRRNYSLKAVIVTPVTGQEKPEKK
jgi:hypothetical protein